MEERPKQAFFWKRAALWHSVVCGCDGRGQDELRPISIKCSHTPA